MRIKTPGPRDCTEFLKGSGAAIYITSEDVKHILSDTMRQLDIVISTDKDNSFVFYDDDGHIPIRPHYLDKMPQA